jgi:hypothetical protein
MKQLYFIFVLIPFAAYSQSGPINIHMRSGGIISTRYAFRNNNSGYLRPYVRINDRKGEKISIERIKHVEGTDQNGNYRYFKPIKIQGMLIWGERTFNSERIDIYYTNIVSETWSFSYKSRYFQYSKDDNSLKKMTYENLKVDLADNQQSVEHLKKGNTLKITQYLLYGVGSALVVTGIVNGINDTGVDNPSNSGMKIPPAFIAGAVTLYIPWFINNPKQNHFVNALKNYN